MKRNPILKSPRFDPFEATSDMTGPSLHQTMGTRLVKIEPDWRHT